jgi:sugar phosphate isomerase/epimerase
MENMEANIWSILVNTTSECPLLIETPAREGTEQLNDPEQLSEFVMRFHKDCPLGTRDQMQKRIGICVDTCHVFAAGHQPMEYINSIRDTNLIRLIHYNDSLFPLNSNRDRHATPGTGEISWGQMSAVIIHAVNYNIPMIVE